MLINCPKCGFSQPKDRYCANCGVDIEAFRPTAPPLLRQIFSNPALHIAVVFLIVFTSVLYIRKKHQEELISRVEFLKSGPIIVKRETSPTTLAPSSPAPPTEATTHSSLGSSPPPTPVGTNNRDANKTPSSVRAEAVHLKVLYAEVDRLTLEGLKRDSQATGTYTEFGDFRAGLLPDINKRVSRERGIRPLERVEKTYDSQHHSQQWFVGRQDEGEALLGLTTLVSLENFDPRGIRGEIEILANLKEAPDALPSKKSFPVTSFDLPPGSGWMVSLGLPSATQDEGDDLSPQGFLKLFRSAQFKSNQTEFTLFLEFDTPAATRAGKHSP